MPAPKEIKDLIEKFKLHLEDYKAGNLNETELRIQYLNPFFEALGWDVNNKQGYAEAYKDVIHEDAIKVGSLTKAPDYCFRIGGGRKFFLEAKKPAVNIKEDINPMFQLRRYAWSAKLPLSILSDFEELAVYDCRIKPEKDDKASMARILYFTYTDYIEKWDEIASIFSKEAVLKGSFDKYSDSTKSKRGTAEVDSAFLKEIENWRELLAKNIASNNPKLSIYELNYAVEKTIDRIIFLRICEDRGIELYGGLKALLNGSQVYGRLCEYFQKADQKYNSGLFHFSKEKDRENPDELTLGLEIDDKPLKELFSNLYYPDSSYEFSVLPADILGQVYEQFLGKVIRLTDSHRAVIEDKPEVKKAGGVFYTPTYIVDYIVKNTVGKILEGKTIKEVEKIKILDPACGSGSFLIGAYQYLLNWFRDKYIEQGDIKNARAKKIHQTLFGEWRLTTQEKKRILLNNIYGVDIDSQAVEVTKLSLLLKVLEGESEETLGIQLKFFHERVLPDLGNNIKCGNSLISSDFYQDKQINLLSEDEQRRINTFDWDKEFPEVFSGKNTGFDVVIGNPPYVRQEMLGDFKKYFEIHYKVYHGVADLYSYFIEKGINLLNKNGFFSIIVSNKWMRANYGEPLRKCLKEQCIEEIIDFGDLPVFVGATTYPCIIKISKDKPKKTFEVALIKTLDFRNLEDYIKEIKYKVEKQDLDDKGWSLADNNSKLILNKLFSKGTPLSQYVNEKIFYGLKTGLNEAFVIEEKKAKEIISKEPKSKSLIKSFLAGKDLKRYESLDSTKFLILVSKGWTKANKKENLNEWKWFQKEHPLIASHLLPFEELAKKRCDQGDFWWELRACDYYKEFEKPKIIYPNICKKPEFTYDDESLYTNQKCFIISVPDKYLLGILNSKIMFFFFNLVIPKLRGGFFEPGYVFLKDFPVFKVDFQNKKEKSKHDEIVSLVDSMLSLNKKLQESKTSHDKTLLQRQIEVTDKEIDRLVYELYDLTEDEIRIVEESCKK